MTLFSTTSLEVDDNTRFFGYACEIPGTQDIGQQTDACRNFAETQFPMAQWRGCFQEPIALRGEPNKPFISRKAGGELLRLLVSGDHLVVDDFVRISHDPDDFLRLFAWFERRGVLLHIVTIEELLEENITSGQLLAHLLRAIRKWRRVKEPTSLPQNRDGLFHGRHPPFGLKPKGLPFRERVCGDRSKRRLVLYPEQQAILAEFLRLYEEEHQTFTQIATTWAENYTLSTGYSVPKFLTAREIIWFYNLGRFYRSIRHRDVRYLNLNELPKISKCRKDTRILFAWRPPPDVTLTDEQRAELDLWKSLADTTEWWHFKPLIQLRSTPQVGAT